MVDLGAERARFKLYPSLGDPIQCTFDDDLRQVVVDNLSKFVRVFGIAKWDPRVGRINTIVAHKIESLVSPRSFWASASVEELIEEQQVVPVEDLSVLYGSWPGKVDDGFEEAIDLARNRPVETETH